MTALSRAKRWQGIAAEACGSLVLVLVLYGLFMLFLYAMFPSGTPLRELMESPPEVGSGSSQAERHPDATLSSLQHDVRFRRGNSVAWGGASEGMRLYSQDAVQTFDRSGASISFDAKDHLQVGSNSLIVVTRLNTEDEAGPKSYRVKVDGELHGTLAAARKLKLELEAAGHLARLGAGNARFRVTRNGSKGASLSVYAGEAQIMEQGRLVRVPANYGVTLKHGVAVGRAVPIPGAPVLQEGENALFRYRLLPPRVRFSWSGAPGEYHFQLASEPHFKSCELDQRVNAPELVSGKLAQGSYYWRVSRVVQGVEGAFSRVGRCRLQQLLAAPELRVDFPQEPVPAASYLLTGTVQPGSRIFVDGSEVALDDTGRFGREVPLKPGVNLIRVEALDPAGNASYASRIVYRRSAESAAAAPVRSEAAPPAGEGTR